MTWGITNKPTCMAEAVLKSTTTSPIRRSSPYLQQCARLIATYQISTRPRCLYRHFSSSSHTLLPRSRPSVNGYPGFRNESRESRHVREHNLFDPQLQSPGNVDDTQYLTDPLEPARTSTRLPKTLPFSRASISDLERELLFSASRYPTSTRTRNLLHHILYDRREKPTAIHYEALILANTSPEYGSAENIRTLVQEMEQLGIPMNINIYNAVLRTLVVHPDVNMLDDVIQACGRLWIEIDSEMQHLICASYVRAGMFEIALQYLEQIEHGTIQPALGISRSGLQRGKAELWLYAVFIEQLAKHGDWEGVLRLCYRLYDDTSLGIPLASRHMDIPYAFWGSLLEQAAAAKDRWVTFWIWDNWVLKAWVKPSIKTCMQVLEISADHGAIRVAKTASVILRFVWKKLVVPAPDHGSELEARPSLIHQSEKVKTLLAKAHENAAPQEYRPSDLAIRRMTADWWMFYIEDKIGLNSKGQTGFRSLRLDPWSMLRDINDPGHAWARVLNEKEDAQLQREEREALRQANVRRAKIDAGRATMAKTLPPQLIADIERIATAELDVEEADVMTDDILNATNSISPSVKKPTELIHAELDRPLPRVRLIDPKKYASEGKREKARLLERARLNPDFEIIQIDDQSTGRTASTAQDIEDKPDKGDKQGSAKSRPPQPRPGLRLMEPKKFAVNAGVNEARSTHREELIPDAHSRLNTDRNKSLRPGAWILRADAEDEYQKDEQKNVSESEVERSRGNKKEPGVRLSRLTDALDMSEWSAENAEMMAARKDLEEVMQRKRDAEAEARKWDEEAANAAATVAAVERRVKGKRGDTSTPDRSAVPTSSSCGQVDDQWTPFG